MNQPNMRTAQVFGSSPQTPNPPPLASHATRPPPARLHSRRLNRQLHPHNAYLHDLRLHQRRQSLLAADPGTTGTNDNDDDDIRTRAQVLPPTERHAREATRSGDLLGPKWLTLSHDGSVGPASHLEILGAAAGTLLLALLLGLLLWMGTRGRRGVYTARKGEVVPLDDEECPWSEEMWSLIRGIETGTESLMSHVWRRRMEAMDGVKTEMRTLRRLSARLPRRVEVGERDASSSGGVCSWTSGGDMSDTPAARRRPQTDRAACYEKQTEEVGRGWGQGGLAWVRQRERDLEAQPL